MKIAIVGGTGKLGLGFVARLVQTSHELAIGSRDISKAREAANTLHARANAMTNEEAANWCDAAILTIPYAAHDAILAPLKQPLTSKIVVDTTVPLNYENIFEIVTQSGKSAAEETNAMLGTAAVFAGFQTISHRILRRQEQVEDVLVAGAFARKSEVMQLIREMNLHPIDAGPLEAARLLERMTALLISINKQNHVKESGLKVTGL
jgi:8-hydroxy-5-deazaflavin:NADPH oxidoreductase